LILDDISMIQPNSC